MVTGCWLFSHFIIITNLPCSIVCIVQVIGEFIADEADPVFSCQIHFNANIIWYGWTMLEDISHDLLLHLGKSIYNKRTLYKQPVFALKIESVLVTLKTAYNQC